MDQQTVDQPLPDSVQAFVDSVDLTRVETMVEDARYWREDETEIDIPSSVKAAFALFLNNLLESVNFTAQNAVPTRPVLCPASVSNNIQPLAYLAIKLAADITTQLKHIGRLRTSLFEPECENDVEICSIVEKSLASFLEQAMFIEVLFSTLEDDNCYHPYLKASYTGHVARETCLVWTLKKMLLESLKLASTLSGDIADVVASLVDNEGGFPQSVIPSTLLLHRLEDAGF